MSDDKKKPISYFLDHPQIKRSKSWGNGAVPNNWEAGQKPEGRARIETGKAMSRFNKMGSTKDYKGTQHVKNATEADQVAQSQKKQRAPKKVSKPVSKVTGLGENKTKDKV